MRKSLKVATGLGLGVLVVGPVFAPVLVHRPLALPALSDLWLLGLGAAGVGIGWLGSRPGHAAEPEAPPAPRR